MSRVVDHLAELTGYRDRDVLDASLATALKDLLCPEGVAIYRAVGEPGQQRWLTRARLASGEVAPGADPIWADLAQRAAPGGTPRARGLPEPGPADLRDR